MPLKKIICLNSIMREVLLDLKLYHLQRKKLKIFKLSDEINL